MRIVSLQVHLKRVLSCIGAQKEVDGSTMTRFAAEMLQARPAEPPAGLEPPAPLCLPSLSALVSPTSWKTKNRLHWSTPSAGGRRAPGGQQVAIWAWHLCGALCGEPAACRRHGAAFCRRLQAPRSSEDCRRVGPAARRRHGRLAGALCRPCLSPRFVSC